MNKALLSLFFLFFALQGKSQPVTFFHGNHMRFSLNGTDSVPYPFIGGLVAPQFSEIDLNGDGVKDLMVFDRSGFKVLCFLNEGTPNKVSYVSAPQYEDLFPAFINWVLLRDYNCDGKEDIFTGSESNGFTVYKNTSQNGHLSFEHITWDLADNLGDKVSSVNSDIPAIDDIDGDGDLDIIAFWVLGGYMQMYQNRQVEEGLHCDSLKFKFVDFCWGSVEEGASNNQIILGQTCNVRYYKKAKHVGSTILTFDADGDGDKDVVLGDVDAPRLTFLTNGKKENSWKHDTMTKVDYVYPKNTLAAYIEKFPASFYLDIDNDGKKDLVVTSNDAETSSNLHQVWWYKNQGQNNNPDFRFKDSSVFQDQTLDFGSNTSPVFFDYDNDGDNDLLLVNSDNWRITVNEADRIALFENTGTSSKPNFVLKNKDYLNLAASRIAGMHITFGDLDNDGKQDMVMGRQNGKLSFYKNTGTLSVPAFTAIDTSFGSIDVGVFSTPFLYDVDGDDALDLLVGSYAGPVKYFRNLGDQANPLFQASADVDTVGKVRVNAITYNYLLNDTTFEIEDSVAQYKYEGYSKVTLSDLDNDGTPEMITGGVDGRVRIFRMNMSNLNDSFMEITPYMEAPKTGRKKIFDAGARSAPAAMDINGDGLPDLLVGNSRGGLYYLSTEDQPYDSLISGVTAHLPALETLVYPNPAKDRFELVVNGDNSGLLGLELTDLLGRTHWTRVLDLEKEQRYTVNTSGLSPGVYFLQLKSENYQSQAIKILVIR